MNLRPSDYDNSGDILPMGYKRIDGVIVSANWKRHIVDNGYNADWKCKNCGYVCKLDFPSDVCPKCDMRGETNDFIL